MANFTRSNRGRGKIFILFPLLLTSFLPKAFSLRCKACESRESWENCDKNMTTKECAVQEERCVKYDYHVTYDNTTMPQSKRFQRDCLPQAQCSSSELQACRDLEKLGMEMKVTCHVSCCAEDSCNSQVKTSASVQVMIVILLAGGIFHI
ncbi:uncharacterized protein LOC111334595 [Stylophora pistillata]|uniref:uncharacterized protein LOC111334595 n=1 Tax=Stylophora pistillata TaxID=50429 RepID=UPI000C04B3E0|nr:uncharacterized protein LOC111334595 [Stylophora pistillata]